jgi:endonuclease G
LLDARRQFRLGAGGLALHFGGRYEQTNWGVPSCELARDPRVSDAGVTFAGKTGRTDPPWQSWWTQVDESVTPDDTTDDSDSGAVQLQSPPPPPASTTQLLADGSVNLVVPLYINLRLGSPGAAVVATAGPRQEMAATTEAMVEPQHDTKYSTRTGYDAQFLDKSIKIPTPTVVDESVVAKAKDGSSVLHYQNFSIVMHAKRRLALFTASNVTAEAKLKKPEAGHDYTRKGLSGLGKNDQEKWFVDPRLDPQYQLSDVFYTKDSGAFDKGHIVRREDVAWGKTYASLMRANGDTYHITNCSPQVAGFNRSNLDSGDNWGGLENVVLKGAATERYCQFAGPVLDASDQIFVGAAGGRVKVRVKIPSRFWKVVVVQTQEGVASYGFVLEQDLSDVPLELAVPEMFVKYMEPLTDLQKRAGITFPPIVLNNDQYNTTEGEEMAFRAGARRRSSAEGTAS